MTIRDKFITILAQCAFSHDAYQYLKEEYHFILSLIKDFEEVCNDTGLNYFEMINSFCEEYPDDIDFIYNALENF